MTNNHIFLLQLNLTSQILNAVLTQVAEEKTYDINLKDNKSGQIIFVYESLSRQISVKLKKKD